MGTEVTVIVAIMMILPTTSITHIIWYYERYIQVLDVDPNVAQDTRGEWPPTHPLAAGAPFDTKRQLERHALAA